MTLSATEMMLAPLSLLYGAATRARLSLYQAGALSRQRIAAPVISVGNITAGGTGKTPLVAWLARVVAAHEGRCVCILTRGYGRKNPKSRVLVSDGERLLADEREGGDEPRMLAEMLRGISAVLSDADRVGAARWAMKNLGSEVFILDDGFQHLRIARDLNIVTVDATNPWGGGHLLPRGTLRESLKGLRRADCLVITRADQSKEISSLRDEAEEKSGGRPVFLARTSGTRLRPLSNAASSAETASGTESHPRELPQPVAAFCAIGNPQAFFRQAREEGTTLDYTRAFPDHHVYSQSEIDGLEEEALRRGARALLTTAKDAVKLRSLRFGLPCYVLEIEIRLDDEARMLSLLRQALSKETE